MQEEEQVSNADPKTDPATYRPSADLTPEEELSYWQHKLFRVVGVPGKEKQVDLTRFGGHPKIEYRTERGVHEMGKTSPPYPAEFKAGAVRLARSGGKPMAQDCPGLGRVE